jgi:hypothetical protein
VSFWAVIYLTKEWKMRWIKLSGNKSDVAAFAGEGEIGNIEGKGCNNWVVVAGRLWIERPVSLSHTGKRILSNAH